MFQGPETHSVPQRGPNTASDQRLNDGKCTGVVTACEIVEQGSWMDSICTVLCSKF
jgi:hypothetical protein